MLPMSPYSVKRIVDARAEEALRRIHHQRLLEEARMARAGCAPPPRSTVSCRLGGFLVAAGRRLQRKSLPASLSFEQQSAERR